MRSMKPTAVALMIGLAVIVSCVTISTALAQADRQGLREGVDYVLAVEGDIVPWDGVVMTREAMDRLLDERDWFLDRIDARDRAMFAAEELITLKEEQLNSYRQDLSGARWEKRVYQAVVAAFTGVALYATMNEQ